MVLYTVLTCFEHWKTCEGEETGPQHADFRCEPWGEQFACQPFALQFSACLSRPTEMAYLRCQVIWGFPIHGRTPKSSKNNSSWFDWNIHGCFFWIEYVVFLDFPWTKLDPAGVPAISDSRPGPLSAALWWPEKLVQRAQGLSCVYTPFLATMTISPHSPPQWAMVGY